MVGLKLTLFLIRHKFKFIILSGILTNSVRMLKNQIAIVKGMNITLAQISPVLGDITQNCNMILSAAKTIESDIIVFPELALSGYPPTDRFFSNDFCNRD